MSSSSSSSSSSPTNSCCCIGNAVRMIEIRRDGIREHTDKEIEWWIAAYTNNNNNNDDDDDNNNNNNIVKDYQMAAWLMAVCCAHPLSSREIATLTRCMVESGRRLEWQHHILSSNRRQQILVDKHSTGGVGDKVSIILAPLVATLGVKVPMMAGRGLGHSGGTIDKLESIPGFQTAAFSIEKFQNIVASDDNGGVGCCIIAAGPELCPADKKLYSLRDVTSTVRNIGLQTASIMCKKIAENPHSIVLDCKYGRGAFQPTVDEAATLAQSMIATGQANGLQPTTAFLTRMDAPLGAAVGNWLEILECLQILHGRLPQKVSSPPSTSSTLLLCSSSSASVLPLLASMETSADLIELVCIQAGQMLLQSGLYPNQSSLDELTELALETLMAGKALTKFYEMCRAQGVGDDNVTSVLQNAVEAAAATSNQAVEENASSSQDQQQDDEAVQVVSPSPFLPSHVAPSHSFTVRATCSGVITEIHAKTIGLLAVELGAGRKVATDTLHHGTGFWFYAKVGHFVQQGDALVHVFMNVPAAEDDDDDTMKDRTITRAAEKIRTSLLRQLQECIVITSSSSTDDDDDDNEALAKQLTQQPIVTHRVTSSQDGMQAMGPLPAKLQQALYGGKE